MANGLVIDVLTSQGHAVKASTGNKENSFGNSVLARVSKFLSDSSVHVRTLWLTLLLLDG